MPSQQRHPAFTNIQAAQRGASLQEESPTLTAVGSSGLRVLGHGMLNKLVSCVVEPSSKFRPGEVRTDPIISTPWYL
jgi:hypothetical protein